MVKTRVRTSRTSWCVRSCRSIGGRRTRSAGRSTSPRSSPTGCTRHSSRIRSRDAAFVQLAAADEFHHALDASEGDVRALLERLAVEEPEADDEPETVRARLVVNTVEPAAERLLRQLLRDGDDRASQVKVQLDAVRGARPRAGRQALGPPCSWYDGSPNGRQRERTRGPLPRRERLDVARQGARVRHHRRDLRRAAGSRAGDRGAASDLRGDGSERHPGRRRDRRRAPARRRAARGSRGSARRLAARRCRD